jgi:hypothetical protein
MIDKMIKQLTDQEATYIVSGLEIAYMRGDALKLAKKIRRVLKEDRGLRIVVLR